MLLSNRLLVVLVWRFDVVHVHDLSHPLHSMPRHFQHWEHERQVRSKLQIGAVLRRVFDKALPLYKEVYEDDLIALMQDTGTNAANDRIQVKRLRVVSGTEGPQTADLTLVIDGVEHNLISMGVTSDSHPFFTGQKQFVDTEGRIDKFQKRFGAVRRVTKPKAGA